MLCCQDERRACLHALGDELGVTRPNVTKLVDGLERGGLVERLPHPSDGRMVQAHLTPRGRSSWPSEAAAGPPRADAAPLGRARRRRARAPLVDLLDAVAEPAPPAAGDPVSGRGGAEPGRRRLGG